jgi:hypothetical protein
VQAHIHMPWTNRAPAGVELLGSGGMIRMDYFRPQWWKFERRGEPTIAVE